MRLSALLRRTAVPVAGIALAGLTATSCAPSTSTGPETADKKTGTVRVWLFREVNNQPKEEIVSDVVDAFEKEHDGVTVDVQYIPVDSRAEKMKGALNDPSSAPDVIEYGNTDTAGYVEDGGLLDITKEFRAWDAADDIDKTAKESVTVDGRIYGAPFFVGVRALYYRTDVFEELDLDPPKTLDELAATARAIHKAKPDMYGLAIGGSYTYGALPFVWAHGGDIARKDGDTYQSTIDSEKSRKGITAYTDLFGDHNCPPSTCAQMGGNDTVEAFSNGKAGMVIAGDFNRQAIEQSEVGDKFDVVPLPGVRKGRIAPAFAGGNNIGVMPSTQHRSLAIELTKQLAGKQTQQRLFEEMGFLPTFTDVRKKAAEQEPFVKPFIRTLQAGTEFVPATPAWSKIDAGNILPTMFQQIVSGKKSVSEAASNAARRMDEAFAQ